jgi:hypothetical protein
LRQQRSQHGEAAEAGIEDADRAHSCMLIFSRWDS